MFAQKTPITALTLHLNDSWGSFYFQDLTDFQNQLIEDYQLRFLILNYLNLKRFWLKRFNIKKTNGFYYININTVAAKPKTFFQPLLLNTLKTNKNMSSDLFMKQSNIITLHKSVDNKFMLKNKFKNTYTNNILLNKQSDLKNVKKLYNLYFLFKMYKKLTRINKNLSFYFKNFKKVNTTFKKSKRYYSTITSNNNSFNTFSKVKLIKNNNNNLLSKSIIKPNKNLSLKKSTYFILNKKTASMHNVLSNKPRKWLLFMHYITKKFFLKKNKTWMKVINAWLKKWGNKLRFKRNMVRQLVSFSDMKNTLNRLTGSLCYVSFSISYWYMLDYKALKGFVAFERHYKRRFFDQLMAATHYSLSQGVPVVLTDYLRMVLQYEVKHMPVLNALHNAAHYWLCYRNSTRILPNVLCTGAKFEVIGKIDGSERTKTWRTYIGSIPTSTLNSNIRYEQSIASTRYGILHIHVWLYYKNEFFFIK